eukprot:8081083-Pyramimonas_sp.AAC.2
MAVLSPAGTSNCPERTRRSRSLRSGRACKRSSLSQVLAAGARYAYLRSLTGYRHLLGGIASWLVTLQGSTHLPPDKPLRAGVRPAGVGGRPGYPDQAAAHHPEGAAPDALDRLGRGQVGKCYRNTGINWKTVSTYEPKIMLTNSCTSTIALLLPALRRLAEDRYLKIRQNKWGNVTNANKELSDYRRVSRCERRQKGQ